ncbi:MAG: hypothetical protein GXO84_08005 [Chlorobi bacterium]|nr:hypothetical protein [Chlorobiota bacterium]
MQKFNKYWEISKNWQLFFPFITVISLAYTAYKLASLFAFSKVFLTIAISIVFCLVLLRLTLTLFIFLAKRWKVDQKWKVIRIFMVFAVTGSISVLATKPIFDAIGLVKENFDTFFLGMVLFYTLKFLLVLPVYKVLLVAFGWVFCEFTFFWNFAKKMLYRLGLKQFTSK